MKIHYKKVKQLAPFCGSCGEELMGDNSLFAPYRCSEGVWRANIDNPHEFMLIVERRVTGQKEKYV
jgi:hypothetical protein